jgi:hypothetical protein
MTPKNAFFHGHTIAFPQFLLHFLKALAQLALFSLQERSFFPLF